MKQNDKKTANKPVYAVRNGAISGRVFWNTTKDGTKFANAIISRTYKAGEGFKESNSYGAKHLEQLAEVVDRLRLWMDTNQSDPA